MVRRIKGARVGKGVISSLNHRKYHRYSMSLFNTHKGKGEELRVFCGRGSMDGWMDVGGGIWKE